MSVINHGVVSIEDGKKAETEYTPARKVRVELHFDVPEGQDADTALAQVSALVDAHVRRLLGLPTVIGNPAPETAKQAGPRGKPKPVQVVLPVETKVDPSSVSDEAVVEDLPVDFLAVPEPEAKITDAELHFAAQKKNGEIKNPLAIRSLVSTFRPAGSQLAFQLAEIPQDRRQEFLRKLKMLS